ncbi:hypothetical protein NQ315_016117, partial [Exocentrus adspersus]
MEFGPKKCAVLRGEKDDMGTIRIMNDSLTDQSYSLVTLEPREIKKQIRKAEQQRFLQDHTNKPQHGVFFRNIEEIGLLRKLTFAFLSSADLKSETEGFLLACQDGIINTL